MEATSDHNYAKTAIGWAAIIAIGGWTYYRHVYNDPRRRAATNRAITQTKKDLGADVAAATTALKKKADKALKPKPKPAPTRSEPTAAPTIDYDPSAEAAAKRDEQKANQDFAQSFSKLKSGHQFSSNKAEKKTQKSIKQSRAQEADASAPIESAPSSAAGDADDDLSSAASPVAAPADQTGVSDMLEASSPGPSVLRLTDTDKVKTAPKKEKAAVEVESKKARQNRLKAERKKLEREQDEVERKKLEEAQRRRARIAEGRPAKDGSSFVANKENAWTAKTNGDSSFVPVQPLDTFEQKPVETPAALSTPKAAPTGNKERSDSWMSSLPSEEDQYAQVLEDSSAWNEVTTKKGKKGKKPEETAPASAKPANNASSAPAQTAVPAIKSTANGTKSKPALSSHSSFAALAPEETADDEVEEEWEV